MAHPADPAIKAPLTFANARLTPEEADRLAAMFRPSWEFDDAPFTGAGSLTPSEIQALQGGGVRADVRAAAATAVAPPVKNGTHAAAAHEPENSVVIDRSITASDLPSGAAQPVGGPKAGAKTIMGGLQAPLAPPPAEPPVAAPPAAPPSKPISQRPAAPDFRVGPPVSSRSPASIRQAIQIDEPVTYPRKSRKGLFLGLGAAAAVIVGIGIYVATAGGEKPAPAAATTTATEKPTQDKLSAVPPPPPAATTTVTAADPTPPPPPPAQTTAAAAPPPPPTPVAPVTALPAAPTPPPQPHYAAAPPPPRPAPAAAPPRPKKGGQTIVRDVPF